MSHRIILIDNYDSFTYNIVQYLGELGCDVKVFRNDKVTVGEVARLDPERIVISPGPGGPEGAGISCEAIRYFSGKCPILGVCLGHQCIGHVFGGKVSRAGRLMHGKTSLIRHDATGVFRGIANPFRATRYHSLIVERAGLPSCLRITAWTREKEIMGLAHRQYPVFGVQFHPESIMTENGRALLNNFIRV